MSRPQKSRSQTDLPADFGFNEEHAVLRQEARRFLAERFPIREVRRLADTGGALEPALWKEMAQLGWLGVLLPEQYGGSELGALPWALLVEEAGGHLLAGPLLGSVIAALAIERAGDDAQRERWLPALVAGERIAAPAWIESGGRYEPESLEAHVIETSDGYTLHGEKHHVLGGSEADLLIVPARDAGGAVSCFAVEVPASGVEIERERTVDATRPTARIRFEGVRLGREARLAGDGARALREVLPAAWLSLAAEAVGGTEAILRMTRDYAVERVQFERPIGFFQAVKHPIVDMMVEVEMARSLTAGAAAAIDHAPERAEVFARMAKAHSAETFARATRRAVQLHGGYGFTWDCDVHFYFRRSIWLRSMLGDAAHHRRRLAEVLFRDV